MDPSSSVPPKPKTAGSRVTLVCAECKRQKLKCDRREPCSTCRKRGTESKCEYSAEAADRIDNQSLANRIASLEATIQNLVNNPAAARNAAPQDPIPLAIGNTGGSLALSFKDTSRVWMDHLDILKDVTLHPTDQDNQIFNTIPVVSNIMFDRLPADKPDRETLLDHLEKTMAMHPCFHFPHFRQRVNLMFEHPDESPSQSFFALAAVGFALGAQSWIEAQQADIGDKGKAPMAYDARELWELSKEALLTFETSSAPDYDSLTAMVLQILYLLHDGETRVEHTVFPLVGKMINTARAMGLQVDPSEYPKAYFTVFEAEGRRRLWWTVYYYDLFVSDYMSVPPLIADDSYTCHLPKDTDEDKLNPESAEAPIARSDAAHPFSFFLQRISAAKLVKSSKQHAHRDFQNGVASIETAREIEQMAKTWLGSLPESFRLNTDPAKLKGEPSLLVAQRCELASIAHQLIITTYAPYLATRHPDADGIRACLDSAHAIIRASETIYSVLKFTRPAAYMFYSFGNQLFHAAIIAAHSVISDPRSEIAQLAMQHVTTALTLMSDPALPSGRPVKGGDMAGQPGEALRVVKMLSHRAETALTMVAADSLGAGFRIPYVGAGVSTRQSVRTFPKSEASQNLVAAASTAAQAQPASQRPVEQQVEVTPSSDAMDTTPSSQWSETEFHELSHHGIQSAVERPTKRPPSLSVRQRGQMNAKDARGARGKPAPRRQMTAVPIANPMASINVRNTPTSTSLPNLPASPAPGTGQFYTTPNYAVEEAKPAAPPQQYTFASAAPYDFTYQPTAADSQQPPPTQAQQPQAAFYNYPAATPTPGAYHDNPPFMSGLQDPMNTANLTHQLGRDAPYPMADYGRPWEGDAGQQAQPIPQAAPTAQTFQWSTYHQQG